MGRFSKAARANSSEQQNFCRTCGTQIKPRVRYCPACAVAVTRENIAKLSHKGSEATLSPAAQAMRSETMKRHDAEQKAWNPGRHPAWLTEETYREQIQPLLKGISISAVAKALDMAWSYASELREGRKVPHPRHWLKLAELVGVAEE